MAFKRSLKIRNDHQKLIKPATSDHLISEIGKFLWNRHCVGHKIIFLLTIVGGLWINFGNQLIMIHLGTIIGYHQSLFVISLWKEENPFM